MARTTSADVAVLVDGLTAIDETEADHRADALAWLRSTRDVFRRVPPKTPPQHLVAYFVLHDPSDGAVLLVHHRKAGLWLPTGGHVDVGEDPAETVRRESLEELGVPAVFAGGVPQPRFVTVMGTRGDVSSRHVDVSLWYLLDGSRHDVLRPDEREFAAARWWSRTEVAEADARLLEPHLHRFLEKIDAAARPGRTP